MKKIKYRFVLFLIAVYFFTFGLGAMTGNYMQSGSIDSPLRVLADNKINILFMGIDARSNEENARSDTMILASIDKKTKQAVLVWIPRDTRVEVSRGNYDKINSINVLQGPEAACSAVSKIMKTNVKYYVVTNFSGFAEIVDILGGVHIDVESYMYHNDPDPKLRINLAPGMQLLNGEDALRYVRYRGGPTADIGRTSRQAKFIKALADEMVSTRTVLKLPQLIPELTENIHTNIPVKQMMSLVNLARNFNSEKIITQTLPGYPYTDPRTGASYWLADEKIAGGLIKALFAGETFQEISDPPDWVPVTNTQPQPPVEEGESENSAGFVEEEQDINSQDTGQDTEPIQGEPFPSDETVTDSLTENTGEGESSQQPQENTPTPMGDIN